MQRRKIGKITAPVGIKGEVRVYPYTDEATRFSDIKELEVGDKRAKVEAVRYQQGMVILKLDIIPDRNAAEAARNSFLYLSEDELWEMPENTYFVSDLLGCLVYGESGLIGELTDVFQHTSAQDLYQVNTGEKEILIPAVKEFIIKVDIPAKRIDVRLPEGLLEL